MHFLFLSASESAPHSSPAWPSAQIPLLSIIPQMEPAEVQAPLLLLFSSTRPSLSPWHTSLGYDLRVLSRWLITHWQLTDIVHCELGSHGQLLCRNLKINTLLALSLSFFPHSTPASGLPFSCTFQPCQRDKSLYKLARNNFPYHIVLVCLG